MATYRINIRTASHIADSLQVEATDLTKLRLEVARFVGELLRDHAELIWADENWRIDVTDGDGVILWVIHISATEAPGGAEAAKLEV